MARGIIPPKTSSASAKKIKTIEVERAHFSCVKNNLNRRAKMDHLQKTRDKKKRQFCHLQKEASMKRETLPSQNFNLRKRRVIQKEQTIDEFSCSFWGAISESDSNGAEISRCDPVYPSEFDCKDSTTDSTSSPKTSEQDTKVSDAQKPNSIKKADNSNHMKPFLRPRGGQHWSRKRFRTYEGWNVLREKWNTGAGPNVIGGAILKEEKGNPFLNSAFYSNVISREIEAYSFATYYKDSFKITIQKDEEGLQEDEVELKLLKAVKFSDIAHPRSTSWLLHTGVPIATMDWCPLQAFGKKKRAYLACSGDSYEKYHGYNFSTCNAENLNKQQVIQIWEFYPGTDTPPRLAIVFCHLYGFCEDLRWCPFLTEPLESVWGYKMLGVIVFVASGKLFLIDVPEPKYEDKFVILDAKPRQVLEIKDIFFWRVSFSWRQHQTWLLAAGSKKGYVTIWDFRNPSNHLYTIRVKHGCVTSVAFHTDDKYVLAAGTKLGRLEVWDLRNLFSPMFTYNAFASPIINMHFIPGAEALLVSSTYEKINVGIRLFNCVTNSGPRFILKHIFNLENNDPWGIDCTILKRKDKKGDLVSAITTRSGLTLLYRNALNTIFWGRRHVNSDVSVYGRILQSWSAVQKKEDGSISLTVGGPKPAVAVPNVSVKRVKQLSKRLKDNEETRIVNPQEVDELANMNHISINRQLVDGVFTLASGGIAGIVHVFQAEGQIM